MTFKPFTPTNIKYSPLWSTIIYWEYLTLRGLGGVILGGKDCFLHYLMEMASLFGTTLGTIPNHKRDPYVHS